MTPDTVATLIRHAAAQLQAAGVLDPVVDAELLFGHLGGLSRGEVQAAIVRADPVTADEAAAFVALVERRAAREPLQHITGVAYFRHVQLAVGPGVFVPRPETELVAQFAIDRLRAEHAAQPLAVDLCTGSGAIALALATEVPHARVYAVELSDDAYRWAERNTRAQENLTLVHGDARRALAELDGQVSVVISNPPYVPDDAIPRDPEVRLFDPAQALYGGADGLDLVRAISLRARQLLHPGGLLVLEHGELQGAEIRGILTADGWDGATTHPDLTQRDRATCAVRR